MNNLIKRYLLFLIGCIGTRSALVYFAKNATQEHLKYMGYLALFPVFGFSIIFLTDSRKTGPEVFGGKIWWNKLRPFHALLYFLFAYNAINGNNFAWKFLLIDVLLGLSSFLIFHLGTVNYK